MTAIPDPSPDPLDGWSLPEDWTEAARDLFAEVLSERTDLAGADLGALEQAVPGSGVTGSTLA